MARSTSLLLAVLLLSACDRDKDKQPGAGLVAADAAPVVVAADAGTVVDVSQCPGCQLAPTPAWTFEGVYRDAQCTEPLAQMVTPACAQVPALGPTALTYVDAVGPKKAGVTSNVTLTEQIAANAPRYRKAGTVCVRANEAAVDITPMGCTGQRVCRDTTGAVACTGCRTFANGCPDLEESRMYAVIDDPELKGNKAAGGGSDALARLRQCCTALAAEAKRQNNAPELTAAAAQCNVLVAAAGPSGTAPELAAVRGLLAGRTLPPVCAGL